jgi:hypothetical protein
MKFGYWNSFDVLTQGFEIRNFINLALYCPWIILFKKGKLSNVIQKIENTKLPVGDFNEKVWKFLSPKRTMEYLQKQYLE